MSHYWAVTLVCWTVNIWVGYRIGAFVSRRVIDGRWPAWVWLPLMPAVLALGVGIFRILRLAFGE